MPCCGLHEYREKVPLKYTLAGCGVFWGGFFIALISGLVLAWTRNGRSILRILTSFMGALWIDTMRQRDSIPARWSCRCSGYFLPLSPRLAAVIYRRPEIAFVYAPLLVLLGVVALGWFALRAASLHHPLF